MQMNSSIIYLTFCLIVIEDLCHEFICIPLYTRLYANIFSFTVHVETEYSLVFRYYLKNKRWFLIRGVYASFGLCLRMKHCCEKIVGPFDDGNESLNIHNEFKEHCLEVWICIFILNEKKVGKFVCLLGFAEVHYFVSSCPFFLIPC